MARSFLVRVDGVTHRGFPGKWQLNDNRAPTTFWFNCHNDRVSIKPPDKIVRGAITCLVCLAIEGDNAFQR